MTLITWFLVFGGLSVAAMVIDGVRRMFASHAALKIDIDESLCDLPISDYGSELPNGGARVVDAVELSNNLDPAETIPIIDEFDNKPDFDLTVEEEPNLEVACLGISVDEAVPLDIVPVEGAVAELSEYPVTEYETEVELELESEAGLAEEFSLASASITLSSEDGSSLTAADSSSTSAEFDPTRPVHEHVESHAMVQNDLFAEQDLATFSKVKSDLAHELIESSQSSDDILFNDTGIELFDDDFAMSGEARLAQRSQDETLTTKLAKVTSLSFGKKLLNRKRAALQETSESALAEQQMQTLPAVEQVVSILVTANDSQGLYGPQLRKLVEACGLVHGEMDIFHRFEGGLRLGKTQFSMANMMEPGTFDIDEMAHFHTPGVVFFLGLPTAQDSMKSFDFMLETAQCLATNLDGEVRDEQRSVMRPQTIEHCRQQIRDFERRNMTRRAQF